MRMIGVKMRLPALFSEKLEVMQKCHKTWVHDGNIMNMY